MLPAITVPPFNTSDMLGMPRNKFIDALEQTFARQTGRVTYDMFEKALPDIRKFLKITKDSVVHANTDGTGTTVNVMIKLTPKGELPFILMTDHVYSMASIAKEVLKGYPTITVGHKNPQHLAGIPSNYFTHSISNFAVANCVNPLEAVREIFRTLRPGGMTAIISWKAYPVADIIHEVQERISPGGPKMAFSHPELKEEGALERLVMEGGFDPWNLRTLQKRLLLKDEQVRGLMDLCCGELSNPARLGWNEGKCNQFRTVIEGVMREMVSTYEGILFEAWVILARKEHPNDDYGVGHRAPHVVMRYNYN